mmetsp:Transcript_51305/g.94842  ORF Transcript_51305/g.94842 Transcript_51305/m.94842 type:complete len:116 (+) Transcript_51305:77-424(+)
MSFLACCEALPCDDAEDDSEVEASHKEFVEEDDEEELHGEGVVLDANGRQTRGRISAAAKKSNTAKPGPPMTSNTSTTSTTPSSQTSGPSPVIVNVPPSRIGGAVRYGQAQARMS